MATDQGQQKALCATWWRVPEEDTDGSLVYRKEGVALPPARGRYGITLREDGSAALHGPGATDRSESVESHWRIDAAGRLQVDGSREAAGAIAFLDDTTLKLAR